MARFYRWRRMHDVTAERDYLGAVLLDTGVLEAGGIDPSHMADLMCSRTLAAMIAIRGRGQVLTEIEGWSDEEQGL